MTEETQAPESEVAADLGQHGHAAAQAEDPSHVNPHAADAEPEAEMESTFQQ